QDGGEICRWLLHAIDSETRLRDSQLGVIGIDVPGGSLARLHGSCTDADILDHPPSGPGVCRQSESDRLAVAKNLRNRMRDSRIAERDAECLGLRNALNCHRVCQINVPEIVTYRPMNGRLPGLSFNAGYPSHDAFSVIPG